MTMKLRLSAFFAVLVTAAGCATITADDLNAVRTMAQTAQSAASDAQRQAGEARQMASGAQSTANQALSLSLIHI